MNVFIKMPGEARHLLDHVSSMLSRKAFNFDLGTNELKDELGIQDTREPYSQIRLLFGSLGVDHRQYSGYVSKQPISELRAVSIMDQLAGDLPWFLKVAQRCDITSVSGSTFDYLRYVQTVARNEGLLDKELGMGNERVSRDEPQTREPTRYAALDDGESLDDYLADIVEAHDLIARANGRPTVAELYRPKGGPDR